METTTVLVTGASGGIGLAFARAYASRGASLVLVARSGDTLEGIAAELRQEHGIDVRVLPCDLGDADARGRLVSQLQGTRVDVLVNNAGYGAVGDFASEPEDRTMGMISLNCEALTHLTHALLPGMLERGRGDVINVASTAAFQPLANFSVYAATKAYVLSFTQGLAGEVRGRGVRVLAICPGPTDTRFFDVAHASGLMQQRRSPEQVVETTLAALEKGRTVVVDGAVNAAGARLGRLLPARALEPLARMLLRRS